MKLNQLSQLLCASVALLFISATFNKTIAQNGNYSTTIALAADKIEPKVIAWRHDIHEHPELGNHEVLPLISV